MKALKHSGLVPATFLKSTGVYAKDETHGLTPADFVRLQRKGIVKQGEIGKDADDKELETVDIDENTLEAVIPMPSLGGYDHYPPLASNAVPGRNRIEEPSDDALNYAEPGQRGLGVEDDEVGRGNDTGNKSTATAPLKTTDVPKSGTGGKGSNTPPKPPSGDDK